jgi:alginate O-acetyltransferase complex protein AlgI
MLFNSIDFLIFFSVFLLGYYLVRHHLRARNRLIVVASYIFYAWWDYRFVGLLLWSTFADYWVALALAKTTVVNRRKALLGISLLSNLGVLFFFKYFNFFRESTRLLLADLGMEAHWTSMQFILPVGISFYTFQTLSYTIDVYRGKIPATRDVAQFMAFVAFFPQLVAGPIERASHLLPQLAATLKIDLRMLESGIWLFIWGLFKKVVLADSFAYFVDPTFSFVEPEASQTIIGVTAFALQIYCDFSGYTDMARGMARMLGFDLMQNFNLPYFATSVQDFWRRWHISLSTWLRDYLYLPLGGNRLGRVRTYLNLMIVMLLGGLWHGAAWNFVAWGLWQGVGLVINRWWRETVTPRWVMPSWAGWFLTILFTLYGWLLFRSSSADQVLQLTGSLGNWAPEYWVPLQIRELLLLASPLLAMQIWQWRSNDPEVPMRLPGWARGLVQGVLIYLIILFWGTDEPSSFIYFQF